MSFYQSEDCFRRYEAIIAKALEKYPESVRFKSSARKNSTDAARCGNAITAYQRNQWPTAYPILAELENRKLSVWLEKDHCVIGPAVKNGDVVEITNGIGDGLHGALRCHPSTADHVKSLIELINSGTLTEPVEIPKAWEQLCNTEVTRRGLLNVAMRSEANSVILF